MPYIRSGNPAAVSNWKLETFRVFSNNYPNHICTYAGAELWSDCKVCDGKREDCSARWGNLDQPIVFVYSLEFAQDKHIKYLRDTES